MLRPRLFSAIVSAVFLFGVSCGRKAPVFPGAPVILISIDTLCADHLPAYGYRGVETPALDALARDAVVFDNAISHVPLTLPSHVSLFTGLLPFQHGVRDNMGYHLEKTPPTLAAYLHGHGYATGAAVSAVVLARATGVAQGFDFYDDAIESHDVSEPLGRVQRSGIRTEKLLEEWIAGRRESAPFFAFLHLYEPHAPYEPPEPFVTRYAKSPYDGEIAAADAIVGRFLEFLKKRRLYDPSLGEVPPRLGDLFPRGRRDPGTMDAARPGGSRHPGDHIRSRLSMGSGSVLRPRIHGRSDGGRLAPISRSVPGVGGRSHPRVAVARHVGDRRGADPARAPRSSGRYENAGGGGSGSPRAFGPGAKGSLLADLGRDRGGSAARPEGGERVHSEALRARIHRGSAGRDGSRDRSFLGRAHQGGLAGQPNAEATVERWGGDFQKSRPQAALDLLARAHAAYPASEAYARGYALLLSDNNRCREALAVATPLEASSRPECLNAAAVVEACLDRPDRVRELLLRSLAINPNQPRVREAIASLPAGGGPGRPEIQNSESRFKN